MKELNRTDLEYLMFLVGKGLYSEVQDLLGNPFALQGRLYTSSTPRELSGAIRQVRNHVEESSSTAWMLDLHLLTHAFLFREGQPQWFRKWIADEMDPAVFFPGTSWKGLLGAEWAAAPAPVVLGRARVVYFIAGLLKEERTGLCPPWADGLMDDECKSAIEESASAAASVFPWPEGRSPFCFPFLPPGDSIQVKGTSLGLSLALGFLIAGRCAPLPRYLVASGSVTGTRGLIGEAEALEKKALCAEKKGFHVFLYPSCGKPPKAPPNLELIPVASLREAWMFAQLHTPGRARELILLSEMLRDPELFVANVDLVDPAWLDWVVREHMSDGDVARILQVPNGPARIVDKIGWALRNWKLDLAGAMAALISPTGFDSMASSSALTALRFCTQNMALANHRGDVAGAATWVEKGERVFERALRADIAACSDFLNNRFIVRHNRYDFSPVSPDELDPILRCLEDRYAVQCLGGCKADRVLGELYGSICQNFGFCGPRYLSQCEHYAESAARAFGGGDVPEYKEDIVRQSCYLAYAELDAGEKEKAGVSMFSYFELGEWEELWSRLEALRISRWQHALLARFLAETPGGPIHSRFLHWALPKKESIPDQDHPWQLWLYNLGRIAFGLDRAKEAASLWQESLRLCRRATAGPTIGIMALLPLSGLFASGHLSTADLRDAKGQVLESAERLNPEHFGILRQHDFEGILQQVWEKPGDLFPFSYR